MKRLSLALIALTMLVSTTIVAEDNPLLRAETRLGKIKSYTPMGNDWMFVEGSRDNFLMTANGRFAITVEGGDMVLADIWQAKEIAFSEFEASKNIFPLNSLGFAPGKIRAPDNMVVFGKRGTELKAVIFAIPDDAHTAALLRSVNWDSANYHVAVYPLLQGPEAIDRWISFYCANATVQRAILLGERLDLPTPSSCDQASARNSAMRMAAMTTLLGIKASPFVVRQADEAGQVRVDDLQRYLQ